MPDMEKFKITKNNLKNILQSGISVSTNPFVKLVLNHYKVNDLYGKAINDKRGGKNNIHSWDIEYKGKISKKQKNLLNMLLKERRKKKWAEEFAIDWMDGMPLTFEQISTFYCDPKLKKMLSDLVEKGYLKMEHPKKKAGNKRIQDKNLPKGYNIVSGKKSFVINKILDPEDIAPTLVAMDMQHLYVVDGDGLRTLTLREGLRLFGYPDTYKFEIQEKNGYDLLGNTVVVPVISEISDRILDIYCDSWQVK